MRNPGLKLLPPVLSLLMAAGLFAQMQRYILRSDPEPYHERVRAAVADIPIHFGDWEGEEVLIPPAAGRLLRPNAIMSRYYQDQTRGLWASLVVVHCRDPRDMAGHYPPNCYPGTGWMQRGEAADVKCEIDGAVFPLAEYRFSRTEYHQISSRRIYNFFVLPSVGLVTQMSEVKRATGDYRSRPFGAAQIQIIVDASTPEAERQRILRDMMQVLAPVIEVLASQEGNET